MANFYGGSVGRPATRRKAGWGGNIVTGPAPRVSAPEEDAGKFTIDLNDPVGSIGGSLAGAGEFVGGIAGGVLGAAGQVGIPGGPNLGDIPEAAGEALGAFGDIGTGGALPVNPTLGGTLGGGGEANIGAIPGAMLDVIGLPGRAVERTVAERRLEATQGGGRDAIADALAFVGANIVPGLAGLTGDTSGQDAALKRADTIPQDLQEALDAGAMTIDQVADEMVGRNAGFSNNPATNLAAAVVFDPLNLIGGVVGKAGKAAQQAGMVVNEGADATAATRMVGKTYNAATHAMTQGQQAVTSKFVGPVTSGIFHALGSRPYLRLTGKANALAPEFGQRFADSMGIGNSQIVRAVMARQIADDAAKGLLRADQYESPAAVSGLLEQRLLDMQRLDPKGVERQAEELMLRVAAPFDGMTAEEIVSDTTRKLAAMTGMPEQDAAKVISGGLREAQTVHLGFYGYLGNKLEAAKAVSRGAIRATLRGDGDEAIREGEDALSQAENIAAGVRAGGTAESGGAVLAKGAKRQSIDVERMTLVAPDTLTVDRADELLALSGDWFRDRALRFSELQKYGGANFDETKVKALITKLRDQDALVTTVKSATRNKPNALPSAIGDVRKEAEAFGYELGFSPKSGWKVIVDEDGVVVASNPFVHFVSDATPVTVRNPIGRFIDSLTRGITQTRIILDSRRRLVERTRNLGITRQEAVAIHRTVLSMAKDASVAPRGLALAIPQTEKLASGAVTRLNRFDDAFRSILGEERFEALIAKHDPATLMMQAFEGDLSKVGLSQKLTGAAKAAPVQFGGSPVVAAVAEGIYPMVRFRLNPLFQAQELGESPFFNLLRGVAREGVPDDLAQTYARLADLEDAKWISEAGYTLNIAGGESIKRSLGRGPVGRILAHAPNVRGTKEVARMSQILTEHPDEFRNAVQRINPRIWRTMEEAYGTADAKLITQAFLRERGAQTGGSLKAALATFDGARGAGFEGAAMETVWNAFRFSFEKSSTVAFRTHYFSTSRSFLERSVNHPYLGLYPASYMWGKVLPEFARFLLLRPFGKNAPLTGMAAWQKVQEAFVASAAEPEMQEWMKENKDAVYLANMLLPGSPENLPVNAPAWARHIAEDASAGRPVTGNTVTREISDSASYAFGPVRGTSTMLAGLFDAIDNAQGSIEDNLTNAAAMYDGMFGGR